MGARFLDQWWQGCRIQVLEEPDGIGYETRLTKIANESHVAMKATALLKTATASDLQALGGIVLAETAAKVFVLYAAWHKEVIRELPLARPLCPTAEYRFYPQNGTRFGTERCDWRGHQETVAWRHLRPENPEG